MNGTDFQTSASKTMRSASPASPSQILYSEMIPRRSSTAFNTP